MITYWNSHYLLAIEKKKKNYKYSCHATLFVLDFWKCCKSKCHPLSLVVATGKHKDAVFCTESAFIMLFHSHYQSAFHWSLLPFYSFHMNISSVNINNHAPLIIHPRKKKYSYKKSHSPLSKSQFWVQIGLPQLIPSNQSAQSNHNSHFINHCHCHMFWGNKLTNIVFIHFTLENDSAKRRNRIYIQMLNVCCQGII